MQARWTQGTVTALWHALGVSQLRFARMLGVDPVTVRRWVLGAYAPTREAAIEALDDIKAKLTQARRQEFLGRLTPQQRRHFDLGSGSAFAPTHLEAATPVNRAGDGTHYAAAAGPLPPAAKERPVPTRRDTNRQLAALVAAGVIMPIPDLVRTALWVPGDPIDADLVTAREGIMSAFVTAYRKGETSDLLPTIAGFADNLGPLLRRAPTWELGLRMATLMVDAHGMAGVLASGWDPQATRQHVAVASRVAVASGVPILKTRAWALEAKLLHSVLEHGPHGSARTATSYLYKAKALARHADGYTRAWVLASYVEEAADLGDLGLCLANMQAAYRAFDTAIGHEGGFFSPHGCFGGELYLGRPAGRLASLAGQLGEAERSVGAEVAGAAATGRQGRMINALCALATVRLDNDEPEAACAALADALATGRPGRLVDRIRAVRLRIDPALDTLDAVRDLDEQLHLVA